MAKTATTKARSRRAPLPPPEPPLAAPVPLWPALVGMTLCVIGLAVAAYLTYAHYATGVKLACPDTGLVNCLKVTTSKYSKVFGIPVAPLGLVFFASMLPLQLPVAWRSTSRLLRLARIGATVVGVGFVLWLLFAELVEIRNICLYCTAVHVLTFLIFISTAAGTIATAPLPED